MRGHAEGHRGTCAQHSCPAALRNECRQWLDDLDRSLPTVVVGARAGGRDVVNVGVSIDGAVAKEKLDGLPIALDPGTN